MPISGVGMRESAVQVGQVGHPSPDPVSRTAPPVPIMATSQMNETQAAMRMRASVIPEDDRADGVPGLRTDNVWPLTAILSTIFHRQSCRIDLFAEHSRHRGIIEDAGALSRVLDHSRQVAMVNSPNRFEQSIPNPDVPACKRQCWSQAGMISVPR